MSWNTYPQHHPETSGQYVVSIKSKLDEADYFFRTIAFYSINTKVWFKYDPFDLNNEVKELIENQVLAWRDLGTTFID